MTKRRCSDCDHELVRRGYMHTEKVGSITVTDSSHMPLQCPGCGVVELTADELAGYERRAAIVVFHDAPHQVKGSIIRYARKSLGLKQTELAALLGVTPETVSHWENNKTEMQRAHQLALLHYLRGVEHHDIDLRRELEAVQADARPSIHELQVSPKARRTG